MKYIVKVPKYLSDFQFTYYIKRITNYKKLWNGINLCLDIEHAHRYCSESTARKAAEAYNGGGGNHMKKELKLTYEKFMQSEDYKKVHDFEMQMIMQMDGIMRFTYENWVKKNIDNK